MTMKVEDRLIQTGNLTLLTPSTSVSQSQILLQSVSEKIDSSLISVEFLGLPKHNPNYNGIDNKIDISFHSKIVVNMNRLTLAALLNFINNVVDTILLLSPKIMYDIVSILNSVIFSNLFFPFVYISEKFDSFFCDSQETV
jgi:hypothetical protein